MKHISVDELLRMRGSADEVRRELLGDFKWEPPHPAPWHIAEGSGFRERVYLLVDANGKCVAELTDRYTAEWLVREWNLQHPEPSPQSDPAAKGTP